nr:MAG: hypothetical protein 1 [Leviviridae sp.]
MVEITSYRKGARIYPVREIENGYFFAYIPSLDVSVHHESILDYLDQNPGEIDPWPHLETIGSDGSFHWNPVIHYSLDGHVTSLAYQTQGELTGTPVFPGESGMMSVPYSSAPLVYAFVDFGNYAVSSRIVTWGYSTYMPFYVAAISYTNPEKGFNVWDLTLYMDMSDPVGSLIKGIRSYQPVFDRQVYNIDIRSVEITRDYPYVAKADGKPSIDYVHQFRIGALTNFNWHDLARDLYSSVEFGTESNGIAYGIDFSETYDSVQKLFDAVNVKKIRSVSKSLSSLYLSYHYGWKLTYQDTLSMIRELETLPARLKKVLIGRAITSNGLNTYSMCTWADTSQKQLDLLRDLATKLDAVLSLENVWDLVPYSFVVDWLIPLGDSLNALDHFLTLEYEYPSCVQSKTWSYIDPKVPVSRFYSDEMNGSLTLKLYQRRFSNELETPSFLPNLQSPLHHTVEGSALIVANATRPNRKRLTW